MGNLDLTNPLHYLIIGVAIVLVSTTLVFGIRWLSKQMSKGRRKIRCHLKRVWASPRKPDGYGGNVPCSYEEATHVEYSVSLDIFNEKEIPIVIRNPLVIFEKKNKGVERIAKKTITHFLEGANITLPPNKPVEYNMYGTLREGELSAYWVIIGSTRFYLEGSLPNNKKIKIHISGNQKILVIQNKYRDSSSLK